MNIPATITDPKKRYDFLLLYDVQDGNPNGDPDAGNLPRIDPETMQGIVTDVCLKRKIRNYVDMVHQMKGDTANDNGIFVRDSGIALNTKINDAKLTADPENKQKKIASEKGRKEMCRRFYDVRMFGGVLTTGENCGQVRGPMQLTFSRSIDPIIPGDISITRVAVTQEGADKESEMGRKAQVPYGLYLCKGFYSPMLATDTGVSEADLELFWQAVLGKFENDRSASRGYMQLQGVFVFAHENPLGNAPSGKLFGRVRVAKHAAVEAPRSFEHYNLEVNEGEMPAGVSFVRLL